ncbi:hypothetical protein STEG23_016889, partial [Scotinomys teguina]
NSWGPEDGIGSPGTGIMRGCEPSKFFKGIYLFKGLFHLLKVIFSDEFCFFCIDFLDITLDITLKISNHHISMIYR